MIAISTAWVTRRHDSAEAMFADILAAGYTNVELNVHLTPDMVDEAEKLARDGRISIISLHNYCPVPDGIERMRGGGDLFLFSSEDVEIRQNAVKWTCNTIETAARLGARLVVAHWGIVELAGAVQLQRDAATALREGKRARIDPNDRAAAARPYLDRALDSFMQVVPTARANGVRLGIENRNYYHEIPSLEEIGEFLAAAPDVAGYWHDIGHAAILEWLGGVPPHAYRERWASQALAVHVHDVIGDADHLPLGGGNVDFPAELAPFPKGIPWIVESHHGTLEEIRRMREELERLQSSL
jgi:sugar phosphate isomerase/epimerase